MMIDSILEIVSKFIPDGDRRAELKVELEKNKTELEKQFVKYAEMDTNLRLKEIEHTGFKSYWRPVSMMSLSIFIICYLVLHYIVPTLVSYFNINVWIPDTPVLPDIIWQVFAFCLVGFAGMRSFDKRGK